MLMRLNVAQAHPAMQMCRIGLMKIMALRERQWVDSAFVCMKTY